MISSSHQNPVLNAVRRLGLGHREALELIRDSRLENPSKRQRIRPNSPRGRLLQELFTLGPCRLVPHPKEESWVYRAAGRGPQSYGARLERYGAEAELILARLVALAGGPQR